MLYFYRSIHYTYMIHLIMNINFGTFFCYYLVHVIDSFESFGVLNINLWTFVTCIIQCIIVWEFSLCQY